ncbi:hypothetical protein N474_23490 [Pseudoalteromonas luteoviolacea CPMOR-2]|uniref:SnoaL-like domain-containing protein n=1 Tax=Pseudoalteromonas luteoviolacea DSM 6061 TaxID=1365250 RepID=A0A162A4K9_9GAMM|nr:nuclear transport factor 2 family protein [Pseudoalteromonas luteoviolacea]KZN44093.1 hypothetical protein N475_08265 [Pseudoalteromonas luteoviolacea DSM 6061]KZN52182.1 hypothetical protein N474_23490 [Pseudoalteromonas luteoviolacea CPMOR-2]MBE0386206.1 hypothetical protein [Pseudoalteromonas luteoviolacea DSM 6061]
MHSKNLSDIEAIKSLVHSYCEGLHNADVNILQSIFSDDVVLKAPDIRRTLKEWLLLVEKRPVPSELGLPFSYQILAVDIVGEQAMVKLVCPLFEHVYIDYLGLLKERGQWIIVNKMYADII